MHKDYNYKNKIYKKNPKNARPTAVSCFEIAPITAGHVLYAPHNIGLRTFPVLQGYSCNIMDN